MALRIVAGLLGFAAWIAAMFVSAGHEVLVVCLIVTGLLLELIASSPLPKGETWRSLPRDDHFRR